jgi:hypothetical protein
MKMAAGAFIATARKRASLSRKASSALTRSVMSKAMPPTKAGRPSGPGMGNLLTME